MIAAIVLTSGSDTQDAAEGASEIGGIATYDQNCRFSGTPIAILDNFQVGTGTATRSENTLATTVGAAADSLVAEIRLLSGGAELPEVAFGADFTGDGFRDDVIPAPRNTTAGAREFRVGFYDVTTLPTGTGFNIDDAANIAIAEENWDRLGLTTGATNADVAPNNRNVQIFVNRASDCWGFRRV